MVGETRDVHEEGRHVGAAWRVLEHGRDGGEHARGDDAVALADGGGGPVQEDGQVGSNDVRAGQEAREQEDGGLALLPHGAQVVLRDRAQRGHEGLFEGRWVKLGWVRGWVEIRAGRDGGPVGVGFGRGLGDVRAGGLGDHRVRTASEELSRTRMSKGSRQTSDSQRSKT